MLKRRPAVRGVALAAAVAAGLLLLLMVVSPWLARVFLFHPDPADPGPPPTVAGVEGEAVTLRASDGVAVRAWWYGMEDDGGTVVVFHGNAGHLGHRVHLARELLQRGFSVLLAGYRGYGGSEGTPHEEGLYRDGRAALAFAAEQAGGAGSVALLGRSLGGAVAAGVADGAEADPDEGDGPAAEPPAMPGALVLDSTFTSLEGMGREVYPFLPRFAFRRLRDSFPTLERMGRIALPVLVVHGEEDRLVPPAMGRELYQAARGPKAWLGVPDAGHNDLLQVAGASYFDEVEAFLRRHLTPEP